MIDVLGGSLRRYTAGAGAVETAGDGLRLVIAGATPDAYSDAQVDDYAHLSRARFPWTPPLTLEARVRFSHCADALKGTAGFGFWNDPLTYRPARVPALPKAVWFFFASAPSNLKLDMDVPGCGWKAATIGALGPRAGLLALAAPIAVPLMNVNRAYRWFWPVVQRAIGVQEASVDVDTTEWHTYEITWGVTQTAFEIDGEPVLQKAPSPRGPLGFVMWIDNQYMVATPRGRFGWGRLDICGPEWLEARAVTVRTG